MFGYIYKTTNLLNGRTCVGQRHGPFMVTYLGSGVLIVKAIKKYGKQSFRVDMIIEAFDQDELDNLEVGHIKNARSLGENPYNITDGGFGLTPETLAKFRASRSTQEHKAFMSKILKGRIMPDSCRLAHSIRMTGVKLSAETRAKMSASQRAFNSIRTPESNRMRSNKLKGRIITPEWAAKIAASKAKTRLHRISQQKTTNTLAVTGHKD